MIITIDNSRTVFHYHKLAVTGKMRRLSLLNPYIVELVYDLSNLTKSTDIKLVCLHRLIHYSRVLGFNIAILPPEDKAFAKQLLGRKWFESFAKVKPDAFQEETLQDAVIPCRLVHQDEIDFLSLQVSDWLKEYMPSKDFNMVELSLKELLNNTFDHSSDTLPPSFFALYNKQKQEATFLIGDTGIGLIERVEDYYRRLTDIDIGDVPLLKWALQRKNSSFTTERNRGFGLTNAYEFVTGLGGEMSIHTNSVQYKLYPNLIIEPTLTESFSGTIIELRVPLNELDEVSEDDVFGDELTF